MKPGSGYSPKHILILIRQLPMESNTTAEIRGGPEFRDWDNRTYMLAAVVDAVREVSYMLAMVNRDPKKKAPERPQPVYRPDNQINTKKKKQNQFAAMARAALSAARSQKE